MPGATLISFLSLRPNLFALKLMSSSRGLVIGQLLKQSARLQQSPIVMVGVIDPVSNGLVASLARPGANVTGLTLEVTREQAGKNLELLKEAVPKVSRVAIL